MNLNEDNLKNLIRILKRKSLERESIGKEPLGSDFISAFLGNFYKETGGSFDPSEKQDFKYTKGEDIPDEDWWKKTKAGRGTGLAQWDDRRHALKKFAEDRGSTWDDLETQVDFMIHELETSEKGARRKIDKGKSIEEMAQKVTQYYERPATSLWKKGDSKKGKINRKKTPTTREERSRGKLARRIFDEYLKPEIEAEGFYKFGSPDALDTIKAYSDIRKLRSDGNDRKLEESLFPSVTSSLDKVKMGDDYSHLDGEEGSELLNLFKRVERHAAADALVRQAERQSGRAGGHCWAQCPGFWCAGIAAWLLVAVAGRRAVFHGI